MKCLVVVNKMAGNCNKLNLAKIINMYTCATDQVKVNYVTDDKTQWTADGYEKIIACGGDGTLYNAINICNNTTTVKHLLYCACGTFNETYHTKQQESNTFTYGKTAEKCFCYVSASGSFCEIGYKTNTKSKQKYKKLAYFKNILQAYKAHNIPITANINGKQLNKNATLVMVIKSNRCFGFNFNKMHKDNPDKLFLLIIDGYKKDNFASRIKMFFPFFRVFFMGLKKPKDTKRIFFDCADSFTINYHNQTDIAIDGEKITLSGQTLYSLQNTTYDFNII